MPVEILSDGFSTILQLSEPPGRLYLEIEVTPMPVDGRGGIDQTTMWNEVLTTQLPKALVSYGDVSVRCAYDPAIYDEIASAANINQVMTLIFPNGASITFFGWVNGITADGLTEGNRPTAVLNIKISNINPLTGLEEDYTFAELGSQTFQTVPPIAQKNEEGGMPGIYERGVLKEGFEFP